MYGMNSIWQQGYFVVHNKFPSGDNKFYMIWFDILKLRTFKISKQVVLVQHLKVQVWKICSWHTRPILVLQCIWNLTLFYTLLNPVQERWINELNENDEYIQCSKLWLGYYIITYLKVGDVDLTHVCTITYIQKYVLSITIEHLCCKTRNYLLCFIMLTQSDEQRSGRGVL